MEVSQQQTAAAVDRADLWKVNCLIPVKSAGEVQPSTLFMHHGRMQSDSHLLSSVTFLPNTVGVVFTV